MSSMEKLLIARIVCKVKAAQWKAALLRQTANVDKGEMRAIGSV